MPNSNNIADVLATDFQQRQGGHFSNKHYSTPESARIASDRDNGTAGIGGRSTATTTSTVTPTSRRSSAPLAGGNGNGNDASGSSRTMISRKGTAEENPLLSSDFWKSSFSSLSALASAALGSDTSSADKHNRNLSRSAFTPSTAKQAKSPRGGRASFWTSLSETPWAKPSAASSATSTKTTTTSRRKPPSEWGPSGSVGNTAPTLKISDTNYKTSQERKREALLVQSASMNDEFKTDSRGKIKRKSSDDFPTSSSSFSTTHPIYTDDAVRARSSPQSQMDPSSQDTLVYIHHVQPTDTLTGVSIRYGCDMSVLRKCNGFWPSDSIQMRQVVLLPVEACILRGTRTIAKAKQVEGEIDAGQPCNSSSNDNDDDDDNAVNGQRSLSPYPASTAGLPAIGSETRGNSGRRKQQSPELTWKHEYYVQVEGFSSLIEIGRVPRQALGFFPRARRKSKPHSTITSTEWSTSLHASNHDRQAAVSDDYTGLPSRSPRRLEPLQEDSSSVGSRIPFATNKLARGGHHRKQSSLILSGPGGVGTLESNGMAVPGPAEDQLNKFVKTHFPTLSKQFMNDPGPSTTSAAATCGTSGLALEEVGSAIESWVKKVATKAKAGFDEAHMSLQAQMSLRQNANTIGGISGSATAAAATATATAAVAGGNNTLPSESLGVSSRSTRHRGRSGYTSRSSSVEPARLGYQRGIFSFDGGGGGGGGGNGRGGDDEAFGDVIELIETPPVVSSQRGRMRNTGLYTAGSENVARTASGVRNAGNGMITPRRRGAPKEIF
ncbi:hypothetical protein KEM54_005020 [Ascosphaera aggregata]|nr:hypothetical protein KEM54_005020 [Ascosphaera aggregata]